MFVREAVVADREKAFREQTLRRLQLTAVEMGVMAVVGSLVALLVRLLVPAPEYVWLRVCLLPLTAVFATLIVRAPSVRVYGLACMATIATVCLNNYLGALGTDRPLMYFLPALIIIVLSTSFFWVTLAQWIGGTLVCSAFLLPFVVNFSTSRTDTVFSLLFGSMAVLTGFVSQMRIRDYQRHAFDQECRLADLSVTDTLTGARSRADFLQQADKVAFEARAKHAPLSLLYLDIDHFKRLNDSHGHAAGDAVLRAMAEVMQRALDEGDVFGRLGGEEFCVLLPDQGEFEARAMAGRLRMLLAAVPRPDMTLTVSVGIAIMREGESVMQTLHRADLAMLKAKQSGRDTVCLAD